MTRTSDRITTYYLNARELVKQNQAKAARDYVLRVLNEAYAIYKNPRASILTKAKTAAFIRKWIVVDRELCQVGITEYVLECFALLPEYLHLAESPKTTVQPKAAPKAAPAPKPKETPKAAPAPAPQPAPAPAPQPTPAPKAETPVEDEDEDDCEIDIPDLLADAKGQGWCAEIFERNKRSVVTITIPSSGFDTVGTGFIISDKGYLLTNDHVVFDEDANRYHKKISIALPDSKKKTDLFVLFSDEKADIALCKFDPAKLGDFCAVQRIEDYGTVLQGADCLIIGNAFGMGLAPFTGIIRFTHNDSNDLVYTAPSNPGDSGGPVFNRSGLCIGINKSKTLSVGGTEADSYANATPMDKINSLLDKWIKANNITL